MGEINWTIIVGAILGGLYLYDRIRGRKTDDNRELIDLLKDQRDGWKAEAEELRARTAELSEKIVKIQAELEVLQKQNLTMNEILADKDEGTLAWRKQLTAAITQMAKENREEHRLILDRLEQTDEH